MQQKLKRGIKTTPEIKSRSNRWWSFGSVCFDYLGFAKEHMSHLHLGQYFGLKYECS